MNAWDPLPNGKHIDTVLEFVRTHPNEAWDEVQDAARGAVWEVAGVAARSTAWEVAQSEARGPIWEVARSEARSTVMGRVARYASWGSARGPVRSAAREIVWGATAALVAWDYAGDLFTADLGVVELAAHGGDNAATLLLPLKRVMEKQHEST